MGAGSTRRDGVGTHEVESDGGRVEAEPVLDDALARAYFMELLEDRERGDLEGKTLDRHVVLGGQGGLPRERVERRHRVRIAIERDAGERLECVPFAAMSTSDILGEDAGAHLACSLVKGREMPFMSRRAEKDRVPYLPVQNLQQHLSTMRSRTSVLRPPSKASQEG